MDQLAEYVDGLPNICGSESAIDEAIRAQPDDPVFLPTRADRVRGIDSAFAIALHMHQPLIPAGGADLRTAPIISNLQYMLEQPRHRRQPQRAGVPLVLQADGRVHPAADRRGARSRGSCSSTRARCCTACARWAPTTCSTRCARSPRPALPRGGGVAGLPVGARRRAVHAGAGLPAARAGLAAPFRRAVRARGAEPRARLLAVGDGAAEPSRRRLRVRAARCRTAATSWVLVQEHTVEQPDGGGLERKHLPHRLVCTSSSGETPSIVAIIKTQGSDTKLVGQMQPYYEAQGPVPLGPGRQRGVPPLVTQIADGENGGVMMNEFPSKYFEVVRECSGLGPRR